MALIQIVEAVIPRYFLKLFIGTHQITRNLTDRSIIFELDDDLIHHLVEYNVEEVFGKLPRDFVGGGRAAYTLPQVTKRQIRSYVNKLHKSGIKFDYTLNGISVGNHEFTKGALRVNWCELGR